MREHNRDIFPSNETIKLYRSIRPIIVNDIVDDQFLLREHAATRAKRTYHFLGRIAVGFIAFGAIYTVAEALILAPFRGDLIVGVVAALLSVIGICIHIYILATHQKPKWLLNRYAAERLRAIKFQGYQLAEIAKDADDLKTMADDFYRKAVSSLNNEINAGLSILETFSPKAAFVGVGATHHPSPNAALLSDARNAYKELRIDYQRRFASSQLHLLRETQRFIDTSADFLYLAGALLVFLALVSKILTLAPAQVTRWIDFLAVAAFITSISKGILEHASLGQQYKTRYERYERDVREAEAELDGRTISLSLTIRRVELLALGELDDFCRAAQKVSYRL